MSATLAHEAGYEVVIGLEVHAQLRTESKLFCGCAVRYGAPPNHQTCPVCLALPGALPVLNERAVELAMRAALAAGCTVNQRSIFARKNYFYPDLPKGYQISQFEEPIATGGGIEVPAEGEAAKHVRLTRIHMEEDAGKSIHEDGPGSHVDLNRTGVPLIEIVSEPDLRSPEEAGAYLRTLRSILRAAEVSDADMEKGQFRCDANVSLRPAGASELGTRTELKNLNSFRFVEAALHAEIARQTHVLEEGGAIRQATLRYDPDADRIHVMREKENADDYRYFPDPDLVPLRIETAQVEGVRAVLPELPEARRARFEAELGLRPDEARLLVESRALADLFEGAAGIVGDARAVAAWVLRDVRELLAERGLEPEALRLPPESLAALVRLVEQGRVTARSARELLPELAEQGGDPEALVRERGLEAVSDTGALEALADQVIAEQTAAVESYRAGEAKSLNFLMGQVMRKTQGKADAAAVRALLVRKLSPPE